MLLTLLNWKKILKRLEEEGGMKGKYSDLIFHLKELRFLQNGKIDAKTEAINENTFAVILDYSTLKYSNLRYIDVFILVHLGKKLKIIWKRHTQDFSFGIEAKLPSKIEHSFSFKSGECQTTIFKEHLLKIQDILKRKYRYTDNHLEDVINGNITILTEQEIMKAEDGYVEWMMKNGSKRD